MAPAATTSRRAPTSGSGPSIDANVNAWNDPANSLHARQNGSSLSIPGTACSGTVAIVSFTVGDGTVVDGSVVVAVVVVVEAVRPR